MTSPSTEKRTLNGSHCRLTLQLNGVNVVCVVRSDTAVTGPGAAVSPVIPQAISAPTTLAVVTDSKETVTPGNRRACAGRYHVTHAGRVAAIVSAAVVPINALKYRGLERRVSPTAQALQDDITCKPNQSQTIRTFCKPLTAMSATNTFPAATVCIGVTSPSCSYWPSLR